MSLARDSVRAHAKRVQDALDNPALAHSAITASWRRSYQHHRLDPEGFSDPVQLSSIDLRETTEQLDRFLRVARPHLEQLYNAVRHSGCCVVLTDVKGIILERLASDNDSVHFDECGLRYASVWSEGTQGTNGVGTCVAENRAVIVHKDQHYNPNIIGMSCIGAPIYDAEGQMIAVIDVSSARDNATRDYAELILPLVVSIAQKIESDYFRSIFADAHITVAEQFSPIGTPLLACDRDDLVIGANRAARKLLDIKPGTWERVVPRATLFAQGQTKPASDDLANAERAAIRRAIAQAGGQITKAAASLNVSRATLYRMMKKHGIRRN